MSKKAILFLALSLCLLITACASNQITSATTDISVESMEPSIKETLETLETYESKEELSESVFPYITITIPVTEGQRLTIGESTENFWSYERKAGYVDELASPTYVFTWNNQYLKGDYEYSYILPGNSYICDAYTSSDAWFTVNRETDSVVEILWKKRVDPVTQNLSNNELIEIAENHLSAYIDRDTYIIEDVTTDEEGPFHLHLRKKIGDTLTTASAGISLRRNGEVMSLSLNMIEEIQALDNTMTQEEKEQLIAKFSTQDIINEMDLEIKRITPNLYDYSTQSFLTLDENQNPCMFVTVLAEIRKEENENQYSSQSVRYYFFVRLTEEN